MKSEIANAILIFALGFLVALDVLFAVRAVSGQRDFRALQFQASQSQAGLIQLQQLMALVNDTRKYAELHPNPELTRISDGIQPKPATR
jgi:hypothetical protein